MKKTIPIRLSTKDKNYEPAQNTQFTVGTFKPTELENVFKTTNYSPIQWSNGTRAQDNFIAAAGFMVDIDDKQNITIDEALRRLKEHNLNYALVTSKSHTPQVNRFHVFLPFDRFVRTRADYVRIGNDIVRDLFPECDTAVMDAARFMFGSRDDARYESNWAGISYAVDKDENVSNAWDDNLEVKKSDGQVIRAAEIAGHTPIHCPFHDDATPSAFADHSDKSTNW